jgi:hypothetical protein
MPAKVKHTVAKVTHIILDEKCCLGAYNKHGRLVLARVVHPKNIQHWATCRDVPAELSLMRREFEMTFSLAEQRELAGPVPKEVDNV